MPLAELNKQNEKKPAILNMITITFEVEKINFSMLHEAADFFFQYKIETNKLHKENILIEATAKLLDALGIDK